MRNLWKRKLRTFLTVLGVVIGTTSIVVMVSIGIGMNEGFKKQIEEWGSLQTITVSADPNEQGGGEMASMESSSGQSGSQGGGQKKTELNLAAIETMKQMEGVVAATPLVNGYMRIAYGKLIAEAQLIGIDPATMTAMGYKIAEGHALESGDSNCMVVGGTVVEEFYNPKLSWEMREQAEKPEIKLLDEKVLLTYDWGFGTKDADRKIKPVKMTVKGILSASGSDGYSVFMPIKELEKILQEQSKYEESQSGGRSNNANKKKKGIYEQAMVKVSTMEQVKEVQEQIKEMGFGAYSLTDQLESMKETTKMLRFMLGAIGAVSLIVAAIGITNTMVMAIYERTREIGVMKVIGASLADIKKLFLTEAAFIGFAGGAVGIVLSLGVSQLVNIVATQQGSEMMSSVPLWLCFATLLFATFIGIASGYFPARRAMGLSALSAIKTE